MYAASPKDGVQAPLVHCIPNVTKHAKRLKKRYNKMPAFPEPNWPRAKAREATKIVIVGDEDKPSTFEKGFTDHDIQSQDYDYVHGGIDNIVARKKEIELHSILDPVPVGHGEPPDVPRVLMDGAPGVGKTTLTINACNRWARGQIFKQYELVVLVPLRQVKYREAKDIKDLFVDDDDDLKEQVVKHVCRNEGRNVVFIFDGYDELSYKQREEESLFLDIIHGVKLPKCAFIVTSRPYASDYLRQLQRINRHVEIVGFKKEQIYSCIRKNISDQENAKKLISQLEEREDIASLSYIPLNCVIMIHVYEQKSILPATITKLLHHFVIESVKRDVRIRHVEKYTAALKKKITSIDDLQCLPKPVSTHLNMLEKLAYHGLISDQFVFSLKELESAFSDACSFTDESNFTEVTCWCLGLITGIANVTYDREQHFQFLHLSVQEFLAARYAVRTLGEEEQTNIIQRYVGEPRFRLFLLFYVGMRPLMNINAFMVFHSEMKNVPFNILQYSAARTFLFFAQMIFESQQFETYSCLFEALSNKTVFSLQHYKLTLFDCMVLAHFLCYIDHSWSKLDLQDCSLSVRSLYAFDQVYKKCNSGKKATFESIVLSSDDPEMVYKLDKFPWLNDTKELIFLHQCHNTVVHVCQQADLSTLAHIPRLEIRVGEPMDKVSSCINNFGIHVHTSESNITLCQANLGESFCRYLAKVEELTLVKVNYEALQQVTLFLHSLKVLVINKVDSINIWLSQTASKLAQCESLQKLHVINTGLTASCATTLFLALCDNNSIRELNISENPCSLRQDECKKLGHALEAFLSTNETILSLHMCNSVLNDELAQYLIKGLAKKRSLRSLDVSGSLLANSTTHDLINVDTQISVCFQTQKTHKGLAEGESRGMTNLTMFSDSTSVCFEQSQNFNSVLEMSYYCDGMPVESDVLCKQYSAKLLTSSPKKLSLFKVPLSGVVTILNTLQSSHKLKVLDLSHCADSLFCDSDCDTIESTFEHLVSNSSLARLQLNHINDAVAIGIAKGMLHSKSLKEIAVTFDGVSPNVALQLFSSVHQSSLIKMTVRKVCFLSRKENSCWAIKIDIDGLDMLSHLQYAFRSEKEHYQITEVDLGEARKDIQVCQLHQLLTVLSAIRTLKLLDLSSLKYDANYIGSESAIGLALRELLQSTSIETLVLRNCKFPSGTWEFAAEGLANKCSLKKLDLGGCALTPNEVVTILLSLKSNCTLEELDLSKDNEFNNGKLFTLKVGCAFETMLTSNNSLSYINLKGSVSDEVAMKVANGLQNNPQSKIRQLGVDERYLRSSTVQQLLSLFQSQTSLKQLQFAGISISKTSDEYFWPNIINAVIKKHNIVTIFIQSSMSKLLCGLCNIIYYQIGTSPSVFNITKLDLRDVDNDIAVVIFRSLTHKTILSRVSKVSLTAPLAGGSRVFGGQDVGDGLKNMLSSNKTVYELSLTGVDRSVLQGFVTGLPENSTLRSIKFGINDIQSIDNHLIAEMLHSLDTRCIRLINFEINKLPSIHRKDPASAWLMSLPMFIAPDDQDVVRFICTVNHICDGTLFPRSRSAMCLLKSCPKLKLSLREFNVGLAVALFKLLASNYTCTQLDLSGSDTLTKSGNDELREAIKKMLCDNKTLEHLNLSKSLNNITATGVVTGLMKNQTLKHLEISVDILSMELISKIVDLITTDKVTLKCLKVTDVFILQKYEDSLWQLEVLDQVLWPSFLTALKSTALERKNLLSFLSDHVCIKKSPKVSVICEGGANQFVSLRSLTLKECNSPHLWITGLFNATQLNKLNISQSVISGSDITMLLQSLQLKSHLIELNINNIQIVASDSCILGLAIESLLKKSISLEVLTLSNCCISDDICGRIASGIQTSHTLHCLDLSHNSITTTGLRTIFHSLKDNNCLTSLNVSWNDASRLHGEVLGCMLR